MVPGSVFLSVILPVFNEEEVLPLIYERLKSVLKGIRKDYEIIFIDDGSQDASLSLLENLAQNDSKIKLISLSRNFGHQIAITAGYDHCVGEYVVVMDCDLQDPPELIPQLIERAQEGYDVVYAVRKKREAETWFKKLTAALFYRLFSVLTKINMPLDAGDFRLVNRKVALSIRQCREKNRFIRGMVSWTGFKQTGVFYDRQGRQGGKTKFSVLKMLRFCFDGITSFSTIPLKLASLLGIVISTASFLLGLYFISIKLFTDKLVLGWASLFVGVLFLGGIQLIFLGIIGEYLGRIYDEVKQRPLYFINKKINFVP
jgi:dolichol-phosphate mannosyltransferase